MPKKTLIFLDNTYPSPYQLSSLDEQALGGTEASIIKTAKILSQKYKVFVVQKFRQHSTIENKNLSFVPKESLSKLNPEYIIVLRKYPLLKKLSAMYPKAKLYLWIHTYKNYEYVFKRLGLAKTKTVIICNSKTHKNSINNLLNKTLLAKWFSLINNPVRVEYCYNPVNDPGIFSTQRDVNKLIYISSPNKGLKQVVTCFKAIKQELPNIQLYIANPGYKRDRVNREESDIHVMGSLPQSEIFKQVSESLCVFYPQDSFAETFGLIYAEANACKTLVLGHDIGSAREILVSNNPLIDVNDYEQVIICIKKWQKSYPKVEYNKIFSNEKILNQWENILINS